jgi:VIT1/CCC1 family predicted Fe2+/Mn2+ transporter
MGVRRSTLQSRYLDPASSLGEVLFGLIMTLTFTLGAGMLVQEEGREGARELLIATIGCNIAWGVIDGVLYVIAQVFERGRLLRLGRQIRATSDEAEARGLVAGELDEMLEPVIAGEERQAIYARIVAGVRSRSGVSGGVRRADLLGALVCFWLVFFASLPAAIPFFFIDDAWTALRVSNAVLLGLLFYAGYAWAKYTVAKPWLAGACFLLGGLGLVAIAIALGG